MAGPAAEAYIIMRADGTLLPRDVKDFARDAGEDAGDEMGAGFEEAFEKRQEKTLKDFRNNVANSLETADFSKFRRKGESVEVVFKRLNVVMEDLRDNQMVSTEYVEKYLDAFDKWRSIEKSKQELTELSEAINEQNKVADTYTKADVQRRERQAASMVNLGRQMEDLGDKSRQMIDRLAIPATLTGNWDSFVKKMGGLEQAQRTLKIRTDEVRKANVAYADSMNEIEESLAEYVREVEAGIEATEQANREKEKATELAREQREQTQRLTDENKKATRAEEDRARALRQISNRFEEITDSSRKALDSLIVKATIKDDWEEVNDYVHRLGLGMGDTVREGRKFEAMVNVVEERLAYLRDTSALTAEEFSQMSASIRRVHADMETGRGRRAALVSDLEKVGDRAGRAFGKGARNDFVNLFGSLVGGMTKFAATAPVKLFGAVAEAVGESSRAFGVLTESTEFGGKGMSKMAAVVPSLLSGLSSMVASGGAAAAAFAGISVAVSALASAISMLGGVIVIAGQAIYLSLAAPLLAMIPGLVSFGAGALVAAGAIKKWADESKALKRAMEPISDELDKVAKKITPAMDGLTRLFGKAGQAIVRDFGDAVTNVLDDFYKKLSSPETEKFASAWGVYMPDIFESLGKAISSFTTGLIAFFVPILPYAERLAEWLEKSANTFMKWAQDTEGQNSIRNWMEDAWDTAVNLWSGLSSISSALGNIFGAATGEGKNFAEWIRDIGERFEKWTESEEGREAISQWLKDAKEFGKGLWQVISLLGQAFDTLDSPAGRASLQMFVGLFQMMAGGAYIASIAINAVTTVVMGFVDKVKYTFENFMSFWENIFTGDFPGAVKDGWEAVQSTLLTVTPWTTFSEAGTAINDAIKGWFDFDLGGTIKGWWDGAWEHAGIGNIDLSGVWDGIRTGISEGLGFIGPWLLQKGREMFDSFVQGIKDRLGIASPSQVMIDLMGDVGAGILQGLAAIPGTLLSAAKDIGSKIVGWVGEGLSTIGTVVGEKFNAAKTAVTTKASEIGSTVSSKFREMPGRAGEALSDLASKVGSRFEAAKTGAVSKTTSLVSDARSGLSKMGARAQDALSDLSSKVGSRFESARTNARSKATSLVSDSRSALSRMGSQASGALSNLSSQIGSRFNTARTNAVSRANSLVSDSRSRLSRMGSQAYSALSNLSSQISSRFNAAKSSAVSLAGRIVSDVRSRLSGMAGAVGGALSGVTNAITSPFSAALSAVNRIVGSIRSAASTAASIARSIPTPGGGIPWFATGGIVSGARVVGVGEAGPEAIVPLDRPLAQVDPSVRWLSAIAQGMPLNSGGGTTVQPGAIQIITPYSDPELVANQVLDGIVANL